MKLLKKKFKLNNIRFDTNLKITASIFLSLTIIYLIYSFVSFKDQNYLLKYQIEYDRKLIDRSIYKLYVASKFPKYNFRRGDSYFINCKSLTICKEVQNKFNSDINELNLSLWKTTKVFVDNIILEIKKKINDADLKDIKKALEANNKSADQSLDVFLDSYKYLLNLEYLRDQKEPMIVMASSEIINNTWNVIFSRFYNFMLLNFLICLVIFTTIFLFQDKRNKIYK